MSDEQSTCPNCDEGFYDCDCAVDDLIRCAARLRRERDEARALAADRKRNIATRKKRAQIKSKHRRRLAAALVHYKRRFREVHEELDEARSWAEECETARDAETRRADDNNDAYEREARIVDELRDQHSIIAQDRARRIAERDEARVEAESEHAYASIVKAENESMRRVVDAIIAWADGIPASNWTVAEPIPGIVSIPPETERWNQMVRAVDEYRKEQTDG